MRPWLVVLLAACLAGCGHAPGARPTAGAPHARYQVSHADGPGPLFLIGGGDDSPPLLRRFIELAGGVTAPIAVVPFAGGGSQGDRARAALVQQGATAVSVVSGSPDQLDADRALLAAAAGIYMAGGYPDRLLAHLPPYLDSIRAAWRAGCVLGGTSAGAMVWGSRVVVKGEAADALAHGLDAAAGGLDLEPGLGFVTDAVVDPHFGARGRFDRLWLASGGADALGIGIDEETAAYLPADGPLEVQGTGAVTLIRPEGAAGTPARVTVVKAGQHLDLAEWRVGEAR